ncbi:CoB--CoM heterodisulfide reductase iron-sulfur subunit B family protein [Desulfocurvus vexinensis]|uniref:CoB--CoM heterodisulfide reductase iron-sulfur subunit B family protein n=1 Tax=Desulfocurvus vexinensis TaxID=399548 RepID=UPI00048E18EE|nr:CoB--CoM heterodisulfide reductase iron-sulfur subunit B family protein [Desulfocurvus vexinensis]
MSPAFAYYPGCSLEGTAVEYDRSGRACCAVLGIELTEIPDWSCCGSSPAHAVDTVLSGALAARNLGLARQGGFGGVVTPCPNCLVNLRTASRDLDDPDRRARINALLSTPCEGGLPAVSLLQALHEQAGPAALAAAVVRPLAGLKVAPYYGCILHRPPGLMAFDDPENPVAMDQLLEAAGAEVVAFPFKTECCGASYGVPRKDLVMELSGRLLEAAADLGADALAVACPLCQMNLDLRQDQIAASRRRAFGIPVFYFTQLLGLALGLGRADLGLDRLVVDPGPALRKLGTGG